MTSKWIVYGSVGVVGLGLLASGAVVAANAIELQSRDGQSVPGGAIVGVGGGVLVDSPVIMIEKSDGTLTIASAAVPSAVAPVAPPPVAPADESPAAPPTASTAPSVASSR